MFNSNSDEHKENNKNSTEFQMDTYSYSTIKIDINHHKLLNLSMQQTKKKFSNRKCKKLTTLPVPRWSPTLVLGEPVGA